MRRAALSLLAAAWALSACGHAEPEPVMIEPEPVLAAPAADAQAGAAPVEEKHRDEAAPCKDGGLGGTGCPVD